MLGYAMARGCLIDCLRGRRGVTPLLEPHAWPGGPRVATGVQSGQLEHLAHRGAEAYEDVVAWLWATTSLTRIARPHSGSHG